MKPLRITQGRDCYAKATIRVVVNGGDVSERETSLDLRTIENPQFSFINILGKVFPIENYAFSRQVDNLMYFLVSSDMPCGMYGLELKGTWSGNDVRAYYAEVLNIIPETEECDLASGTFNGLTSYDFHDRFIAPFSGVVFPYLRIDTADGYLYADHIPDGGNFSIEEGYLTATYNDEGTSW